jgi:hypothetical protein
VDWVWRLPVKWIDVVGEGGTAHSELEGSGFTLSLNYALPKLPNGTVPLSYPNPTLFSSQCNNSVTRKADVIIWRIEGVSTLEIT